jgi:hypothetical protein
MRKTKRTQPAKMVTIRVTAADRRTLKMEAATYSTTIAGYVSKLLSVPR